MFPGDAPGDGQARAAMKKIFRYLILLANLSLHAAAWGDMADNGVECSVVMEKTRFDTRETFPDFKLVFTNKGEKTVRLFDDFYPLKDHSPNIHIEIWRKEGEKRIGCIGSVISDGKKPLAWYSPLYTVERLPFSIRFITLQPGEKHEVPIKEAYLLLTYFDRLRNGQNYELEVRFRDECSYPDARRVYVGKAEFSLSRRSPKGVPR